MGEGGKARWKMPIEIGNVAANGCRTQRKRVRERGKCNLNIYYIISARSFVAFHFGAFTYAVRGGFTLYYVPIYTLPPPSLGTSTTAHDTQSQVDMAMPIGFIGSVLGAWSLGAQRRQTTNLAANCPTRVGPPLPLPSAPALPPTGLITRSASLSSSQLPSLSPRFVIRSFVVCVF